MTIALPYSTPIAASRHAQENQRMRCALYFVAASALLYFGGYAVVKKMSVDGEGVTVAQSIRLASVRKDLIHIAEVEHKHIAMNGACLSIADLISDESEEDLISSRHGYTYSIDCSEPDFTVNASHSPAPVGSHLRFPRYTVDQDIKLHQAE
jgi:hypothetical protein